MPATLTSFRCMMCGHDYQETADPEEDRERSCPRCRSNSIRVLTKSRPEAHR
jgi:putative FmdB family regulatory protein